MAIKINRWRPDTCGCVIEYEWDEQESENTRTHAVAQIIEACPAHSNETDKGKHFEVVLEENRRKNRAQEFVYQNGGKKILTPEEKEQVRFMNAIAGEPNKEVPDEVWKPGVEFYWSFDADRNLLVDVRGFTLAEITNLRNKRTELDKGVEHFNLKKDKIQIV